MEYLSDQVIKPSQNKVERGCIAFRQVFLIYKMKLLDYFIENIVTIIGAAKYLVVIKTGHYLFICHSVML